MTVNFWGGWLYCLVGLLSGIGVFAWLLWHTEKCDRCVFGRDIMDKWSTTAFSVKLALLMCIISVVIWPVGVIYAILILLPQVTFERLVMRPVSMSSCDVIRAWYKCHPKRGWQLFASEEYVDIHITDKDGARIATVKSDVGSPSVKLTYNKVDRQLSMSDPKFFNSLGEFMRTVSKNR